MKKEAKIKIIFPEFTMLCHSCQQEFKLRGTYEEADKAVCPFCQSDDVENLYISFSEDGPGFNSDSYRELLTKGGCSASGSNR